MKIFGLEYMEVFILLYSIFISYFSLDYWYTLLLTKRQINGNIPARFILGLLPVGALCINLFTLNVLASFDVVNSFIYILVYAALGETWFFLGTFLMTCVFDISWLDDALNLDNKAALLSVSGGFLGLTLIYSGANVGDGPGWWCVIFAAGLGSTAWFVLGLIINKFTQIFERITVERDIGCGIRLGAYLLASGIILARACAGDWTSYSMTVVEFLDGWSVLFLAGLLILVERNYASNDKSNENSSYIFGSIFVGLIFITFAVAIVYLLPPPHENPIYRAPLEAISGSLHI